MRLFMDLYPLMAVLLAAAAVTYTLTMGHGRAEPLLWAAVAGGLTAVPVSLAMTKARA